ncbi:FmdE family protein [Dethiosulfatarculus sandiegensis]|uniref:Formylmethanofuran dehydrogenase subunit E n=1 Tax=Dethiosulfatarculus sandiegensis TaxID=1429043 RepID=A0A0D2GCN6_9BACT|nr:FmdE family protein [Dethiosulfatarculus sandiegensis]KIX12702.1 formylmethanofuran dehydrogenase subunit E [Dethiosulfatarculus sandiegensis]
MRVEMLPLDLQKAVDFHGHLCPGLLIGYRAVKAAMKALKLNPSVDEELVAEVENDSCSVDAFQSMLSTTFGKGNLRFLDHGKQVFTITDRSENQAVRIVFIGDKFKDKRPDGSTDRKAYMKALLDRSDDELLKVEVVDAAPPAKARIEPSLVCQSCGENVQQSKSVNKNGRVFCKPCAQKESN